MIKSLDPFSNAAWERNWSIIRLIEPELAIAEREKILLNAGRESVNTFTSIRREVPRPNTKGTTLVAWQPHLDDWFYAWTLKWVGETWYQKHCGQHAESLTPMRFLAILIACGTIAEQGRAQTQMWLLACMLDVLHGLDRRKAVVNVATPLLNPNPAAKQKGGGEEGYRQVLIKLQKRFCKLSGLRILSGVGPKPNRIDGLQTATASQRDRFWSVFWPRLAPHYPWSGDCFDLQAKLKSPKLFNRALFHLILRGDCWLQHLRNFESFPEVHLPNIEAGSSQDQPKNPDISGGASGSNAEESAAVSGLRDEFKKLQEKRHAAAGRLMISIDGRPAEQWNAMDTYQPERSVELLRSGEVLVWHEVGTLEPQDKSIVSTQYRVGGNEYVVAECGDRVTISVTQRQTAWYERWPRWISLRTALAGVSFGIVAILFLLLFVPLSVNRMSIERLPVTGTLGGLKETGRVVVERKWRPLPATSYHLELLTEPLTICPISGPPTRAAESWRFIFDCDDKVVTGLKWSELPPAIYQGRIVETRLGWIKNVSSEMEIK